MARLPTPGGDDGDWGDVLNNYLSVELNPNGTLKNGSITSSKIADGAVGIAKLGFDPATQGELDAVDSRLTGEVDDVNSRLTLAESAYLLATAYAAGNGTTDDTAALQQWIDAASAQGRKAIAPKRTYLISNKLELPSNFDVDWQGSTLKIANGTAPVVSALRVMGRSGVRISNLRIDGNSPNRPIGSSHPNASDEYAAGNGIAVRANPSSVESSDVIITNVYALNNPGYGFSVRGANRILLYSCTADGFGDDGFDIGGYVSDAVGYKPASNVAVTNCVGRNGTGVYSGNTNGFEVDDGAYEVTITNCLAENTFGGFEIHPHPSSPLPHNITITGCVARAYTNQGFEVAGTSAMQRPYNVTLVGNVAQRSGFQGMFIQNARAVLIEGNIIENDDLLVRDACEDISIIGNTMRFMRVEATQFADMTGVIINGNTCDAEAINNHGMMLRGTDTFFLRDLVCEGNIVRGPLLAGINMARVVNAVIANNRVTGHGQQGILCTSSASSGISITNNLVTGAEGVATANTEGIAVTASSGVLISGNRVVGGRRCILLASASSNSTISGNICRNPGEECISLNGCPRVAVTGNNCVGGTRGIDGYSGAVDATIAGNLLSAQSVHGVRQQSGADFWAVSGNNYRGLTNSLAGSGNQVTGNVS